MDIIITGAKGRLGRTVLKKLATFKPRHKIFCIDRNAVNTNISKDNITWVHADINNVDFSMFNKPVVLHLAGIISYKKPYNELFKVNVLGTKNIATQTTKSNGRIIFISSTSVYGKKNLNMPVTEKHDRNPTDNYGLTKMYAEDVVGKNSIILRPCPIYGPGFEKGYYKVFSLLSKNRMPLLGNADNHVPVIHVSDVADAIIYFIKNKGKHKIYNVTPEQTLTQKQLLDISAEQIGCSKPSLKLPSFVSKILCITNPDMKEYVSMLTADRLFSCARLKAEAWRQKIKIRDGIKQMVKAWKGDSYD